MPLECSVQQECPIQGRRIYRSTNLFRGLTIIDSGSLRFAFIEVRSIEETDRCLNLSGLPFMGANLKIGRPSKYSGPITTATSWSEVLLNLGADTVDWSSPAALVLKAGGVDTSLLTLEHNASKRELFIANVQPESSDLTLRAFLETLIAQAETAIHTGDIIKSLRLSGTHAFLEAQSSCHASAPLRV